MPGNNLWSRLRKGRLFQVLLVYLGVSWVVLQVVNDLGDTLNLPKWVGPVALILLLIGLVIVLATAWVQSHPVVDLRAQADELPRSWEVDVGGAVRSIRGGRLPHLTWGRALLGGVIAFALLFGAAGLYVVLGGRGLGPQTATAEAAPDGIAVLPFAVQGQGIGDWREGLVDLLSTGLDGAGGLRAIASRSVLARWHSDVRDSTAVDEGTALEIARRLGARYAMIGTAVAIGPRVRVTAELHQLDPNTDRQLGQVQVQGPPDSVLSMVDSLSLETLSLLLRRQPEELPRVDVASVTTTSLPALKAYLEGESLFRRGEFGAAAEALTRAVGQDSTFGLAYYRLSQAYGWNENIASARAADATAHAMRLLSRLPDRVALLVRGDAATERLDASAVPILEQAVKKYPDDAEAWYALGDAYLHVREALHGWDDAVPAFQRAIELAPGFAPYRIHLMDWAFRYKADSALAAQNVAAYQRLAPGSAMGARYGLALDLAFGDSAHREAAFEEWSDSVGQGANVENTRQVTMTLLNPRLFGMAERMLREALARAPASERTSNRNTYAAHLVDDRGRLHDALEVLRQPGSSILWEIRYLAFWKSIGLPTPEARLDSLIQGRGAGDDAMFAVALRAAEKGETTTVDRIAARAKAMADTLAARGDSLNAAELRAAAGVMQGYDLWRQGRDEDAIRVLEADRAAAQIPPVTWWLGLLELKVGRPADAVRYLKSLMTWSPDPLAAYYLGQAYQAMGDRDDARQMLGFFTSNWQHADPELQPMVKDAQARLKSLMTDTGK
jgi:tetratricopeptide (TPR) repeat protein/TolB-like protein